MRRSPSREVLGYGAAGLLLFLVLETLLALAIYWWPSFEEHSTSLKPLFGQLIDLLDRLDGFKIRHVPREQNTRADSLANAALDGTLDNIR